jgi:signal transduction histidine kinase
MPEFDISMANRSRCRRRARIWGAILVWLLPLVAGTPARSQAPLPRSILVINQSDPYRPWPSTIIAEIRSLTRDSTGGPLPVYTEHLDLNRFSGAAYAKSIQSYYREKYRDKPIGVIVAIGPAALDFSLSLRTSLWPGAAIVFAAVDEQTANRSFPPGVTGIVMRMTLADMITAARALIPELKGVAIVGDRFEDQLYFRHFAEEISDFSRDLQFIDLMGLPLTQVRQRVARLPDHTAILYIGFDPSAAFVSADVVGLIAKTANRPVIVDVETYLGSGAVGGLLLSPGQVGRETARLVRRIIDGESTSSIPIESGSSLQPIFDWRQLQRWGIAESRLPPGSEIRFRTPSMWEQYRAQMFVAVMLLLTQAGLITWLAYEHRRRNSAEVAARNTLSELTHMNRVATAGELSASIAHEVNQPLTGIALRAGAALRWLRAEKPDLAQVKGALEQIADAAMRASDIVKSVRALFKRDIQVKGPVDINGVTLAVLALVRIELRKHDIETRTELSATLPLVIGDATQLQQAILNLVMNAIEAMQTVPYRVLIIRSEWVKPDGVHVSVEDTGTGVDPSNRDAVFKALFTTKATGMGMGLAICQSIIENHGGRVWVTAGTERGSVFQFTVPVADTGEN